MPVRATTPLDTESLWFTYEHEGVRMVAVRWRMRNRVEATFTWNVLAATTLEETADLLTVFYDLWASGWVEETAMEEWRERHGHLAPAFVCPACNRASWNMNDRTAGYCGACHDYTGTPGKGS
jgi:hypothetical protein